MAFFQSCPSKELLSITNDPQFLNCLADALLRSKTRTIDVLVSNIIKVLVGQQYLGGNHSEALQIDFSDSLEHRKLCALELASLVQLSCDRLTPNISSAIKSFQNSDDLAFARIQKASRNPKTFTSTQNSTESLSDSYSTYFNQISRTNHHFGCVTLESCSNQSETFKRCLEQIMHNAKRLEHIYKTNQQINLRQFSSEIHFVGDLFSRLQNENL